MPFASVFHGWPDCAFVETYFRADPVTLQHLATLYPLPETLQRAVLKRQVEFLAGRVCARQAVARVTGRTQTVLPALEDRSPGWPAEVVGAITHTAGYAAALVAPRGTYGGVGIDCERCMTPEQLALQRYICVADELESLVALHQGWSPAECLTLIFSAKESLYKCLYPQVRTYFGFHAARVIAVDIEHETFAIQLAEDLNAAWRAGAHWTGCFGRHKSLLMTAMVSRQRLEGCAV